MSRSTLVFHKEDGAWRVLHAHFSVGDLGQRPGGRLNEFSILPPHVGHQGYLL